jgi:YegS/Rv2252/BmrU family lipid kinase
MSQESLLILNPASAAGATGRHADRLERRIADRLGAAVRTVRTEGPRDAERLAREATRQGVARILVGGGDGTLSEVVSGLLSAQAEAPSADRLPPELGLLPLGSGWDLARSLELPRDLESALTVIADGRTKRIDAGAVEYRDGRGNPRRGFFANEASAGLSGVTVRRVGETSKRFGPRLGFIVGAVGAIIGHRPVDVAIEIDEERIYEGPVSMVVAANGGYFGAGMRVAPQAVVDDGQLEVLLVRGLSMPRLLANLPAFYLGRHLDHPKVSRHAARTLTILPKEAGAPIDVDGEALGELPMIARVLPGALRVRVPSVHPEGV